MVSIVLQFVVTEVCAQVLDVEARLLDRVEADDEILKARLSGNEKDPLVQRIHRQLRAAARPLADKLLKQVRTDVKFADPLGVFCQSLEGHCDQSAEIGIAHGQRLQDRRSANQT